MLQQEKAVSLGSDPRFTLMNLNFDVDRMIAYQYPARAATAAP